MTLPTTRIDTTLISPNNSSAPVNPHNHNSEDGSPPASSVSGPGACHAPLMRNSQEILLVDFVPYGANGTGTVSISSSTSTNPHLHLGANNNNSPKSNNILPTTSNLYQSGYHIQGQQPPSIVGNDLSNFTLVNLSNQNETEDADFNNSSSRDLLDDQHNPSINDAILQHRNEAYHHNPSTRGSFSSNGHLVHKKSFRNGGADYIPICAQPQQHHDKLSSSFNSSSDDSDTGFLVPQNGVKGRSLGKDRHYRLQKQSSLPTSPGYPGSPGFNSNGQQTHRKRLRRKRTSGRKRTGGGGGSSKDEMEASDLFPICCCFGDDHHQSSSSRRSSSSISKYFRCCCIVVMIIFIATFSSIMVSLQRKIDTLSGQVNKQLVLGEDITGSSASGAPDPLQEPQPSMLQELLSKQELLNVSISSLKTNLDELSQRISNIEKQPSVEEVRKELARLGSELTGSVQEIEEELKNLKQSIQSLPQPVIEDPSSSKGQDKNPGQGQSPDQSHGGDSPHKSPSTSPTKSL